MSRPLGDVFPGPDDSDDAALDAMYPTMATVKETPAADSGSEADDDMEASPAPTADEQQQTAEPEVDEAVLESFLTSASELGVTEPAARRLLVMHNAEIAKLAAEGEATVAAWGEETRRSISTADIDAARRLVHGHSDPALLQVLEHSGIGNHPVVVRFLASLATRPGGAPRRETPMSFNELSEAERLALQYPKTAQTQAASAAARSAAKPATSQEAALRQAYPNMPDSAFGKGGSR